jgi:hypothetical protein
MVFMIPVMSNQKWYILGGGAFLKEIPCMVVDGPFQRQISKNNYLIFQV